MIPHEQAKLQVGDVALHYRRFGSAGRTPVLIAHGLSYFSYDWIAPAAELARDRVVVAVDVRGFGDSSWSPSRDYTVATMAADLLAIVDHLGWSKVVLVGHSMSGRATSYLAAEHPERVAGLVLVDYTPENAPAGSQRVTRTVAGQPDSWPSVDDAMRYFGADPGGPKRPRFAAYLRPVAGGVQLKRDLHFRDQFKRALAGERTPLGVDMWQTIGRVRAPILSMRGTRSDMYAAPTTAKMLAANPRMQLVEIDAGHDIAGEIPTAFLASLRAFIVAALER